MSQEEVTIDELRRRGKVIDHPNPPGNILFPDLGRQCSKCGSWFSCSYDLQSHKERGKCYLKEQTDSLSDGELRKVQWKPFKSGKGEWAFRETVPTLTKACSQFGETVIGDYRYRLSGEKFIVRERCLG